MLDKLERKFGRYAINNLIVYVLAAYLIGYLLELGQTITGINFIGFLTLSPSAVLRGQIWRLVTWVLVPPPTQILWLLIMVLCYYQMGMTLERMWGAFRFNVFIFGGMIFTVIGVFIAYFFEFIIHDTLMAYIMSSAEPFMVSTYYIVFSLFLAMAMCAPDMQVLMYFIIPIKMKWAAIFFAVLTIYDMFKYLSSGFFIIAATILMSFINVLVFNKLLKRGPSRTQIRRQQAFKRGMTPPPSKMRDGSPIARHKCAVCGCTDVSHPQMEFRYCSKCNGNYEYCSEHLFTHVHIK